MYSVNSMTTKTWPLKKQKIKGKKITHDMHFNWNDKFSFYMKYAIKRSIMPR